MAEEEREREVFFTFGGHAKCYLPAKRNAQIVRHMQLPVEWINA